MNSLFRRFKPTPVRAMLLYFLIGGSWIFLSDYFLVHESTRTVQNAFSIELSKGLGFIFVTGLLLYFYLRYEGGRRAVRDQRLSLIVENASDVIFSYRSHPRPGIEFISPAALELFGYDPDEFYDDAQLLLRIVYSQDLPALRSLLERPERVRVTVPIRWVHKSGKLIWSGVRGGPMNDSHGRIIGFEGILHDISALMEIEEQLRRTVAQLQAVFDASPLSTYALDPEGVVLLWNSQAADTFGWSEEEAVGTKLPTVSADEMGNFDNLLRQIILDRKPLYRLELVRRRKDGRPIDIVACTAPLKDNDGDVIGLMVVVEDVTELKQREREKVEIREQLLHAQKMETVGRLAGGVAHDINNALSVILMSADMMQMSLADSHPLHDELDNIVKASESAASICRQLLTFSRRQKTEPKRVNLSRTVTELQNMIGRLIGEQIHLELNLDPSVPGIRIDPTQLEQIIVNLVVNARDAIEGNGTITIKTRTLRESDGHSLVQLSMTDTGHGMDKATLEKIFDPFFTTKPSGIGTGLGLSTVYGITQQSNGEIRVQSAPGKGTTFIITFPEFLPEEGSNEDLPQHATELHGNETIFVVEDDARLRGTLLKTLRLFGYRTIEAQSGERALAILESDSVAMDMILVDLIMPGISGIEFVRSMPETVTARAKVLFMSGYVSSELDENGRISFDHNFIKKPFTQRELLEKIRELLAQTQPGGNAAVPLQ